MNCPYCDQNVWIRKHENIVVCHGCGFSAGDSEALGPESMAYKQLFANQTFKLTVNSQFASLAFAAQQQNMLANQAQAQCSTQMAQAAQMQNGLVARGLGGSSLDLFGLFGGK